MKLSYPRPSRRDLFKWMGGAALALPCLELFELPASAQTAARQAKFAVFIYTNDGIHPPAFFPTGGTDPTASPTLASLAPHKAKVTVLGAPVMANGFPVVGSGLAYNSKPEQHRAVICFTASKATQRLNTDQFTAVNKADGPSMDYVIAKAFNTSPLLLAMHPIGGDTPSDVTYDTTGNPQTRLSTAADILKNVFGGIVPGPAGSAAAAAALRKQTAITDFLNSRFAMLRPQISVYDQQLIDAHLAALHTYETGVAQNLTAQGNPATACAAPSAAMVPTDAASLQTGADTQFLSQFIMQTIALAFSCNKNRVATVSFGYPGGGGAGGLRMPWLGFSDPQHGVSHNNGNPTMVDRYAKMNAWTVSQMAYLMDQLAAVKTPTGTMLDDTVVYMINRHGEGNGHTNYALPGILGGGAGGYLKMGQYLQLPATSPTTVLISIAHAMGVPVTSFGSGPYVGTTELAAIKA
ncbi:MAG: DUF1552 domain-containing protein [Myxococcota bacterium]|nr:DUF1552 domain-containing protein [Myxococcota bacterium]